MSDPGERIWARVDPATLYAVLARTRDFRDAIEYVPVAQLKAVTAERDALLADREEFRAGLVWTAYGPMSKGAWQVFKKLKSEVERMTEVNAATQRWETE